MPLVMTSREDPGPGLSRVVHLWVQLHVGLLLVVVPQLLGGSGFLWQVRLLSLLNQIRMLLPAGQLKLAAC